MNQRGGIVRKWRPPLWLVIALVCIVLVALPILAVLAARLTSNQFVQETERSLLAQAAIMSEIYAHFYSRLDEKPEIGQRLTSDQQARLNEAFHPVEPRLNVFLDDILPPRPDGRETAGPAEFPYSTIADELNALIHKSQKTTLTSYLLVDATGRTFASTGETGLSYDHVEEIRRALAGEITTTLRQRTSESGRHPLNSISRDTSYRVFVAYPVIVDERIVGAVQVSRTPVNLQKFFYRERFALGFVALFMVAGSAIVGFLLWRQIFGPVQALIRQSRDVTSGTRTQTEPLAHYGVHEVAELGESIMSMSRSLSNRSQAIETYTSHVTHELKSPVTSIVGAAELLKTAGDTLLPERRDKLHANIHAEGLRMNALLERLRELARAKAGTHGQAASFAKIAESVNSDIDGLEIICNKEAEDFSPLTMEQGVIALTQMAQNALQHGATRLTIDCNPKARTVTISDNGSGISQGNVPRVTEPFFTTRRTEGGTGMGLAIVAAILQQAGGSLAVANPSDSATFHLNFENPEP